MRIYNIFISHSWTNSSEYNHLVEILSNAADFVWQNLSIPEEKALEIWSKGQRAHRQEIELQLSREQTIYNQIEVARQYADKLGNELDQVRQELGRYINEAKEIARQIEESERRIRDLKRKLTPELLIEQCEQRIRNLEQNSAGDRLIAAEKLWLLELKTMNIRPIQQELDAEANYLSSLNAEQEKYQAIVSQKEEHFHTLQDELLKVSASLRNLEADRRHCRDRLDKLQRGEIRGDAYDFYTHDDLLYRSGKADRNTVRLNPTLALAIYNEIFKSDIVLIIAGMYVQYRSWMDYEFKTAANLGKPVIGIIPPDQIESPREIIYYCREIVTWDPAAITRAVQDVCRSTDTYW